MTDNEIIKALECCGKAKTNTDCRELKCPFFDDAIDMCGVLNSEQVLIVNALDKLNRQKAEIERLQKLLDDKCDRCIARDKAEAYKELLNLLEGRLVGKTKITAFGYEIAIIEIKNLLKEMVGEDK